MTRILLAAVVAVFVCLLLAATPASAQDGAQHENGDNPLARLPWQFGPSVGKIGNRASVEVPEGYAFLGADGTRGLNEILENPPSEVDTYTLAPQSLKWIGFFRFDEMGYVKDNETVDADEVLESIRAGTQEGNKERRRRGWDTLRIIGWSFKPQYDIRLKALEWAVLAETETSKSQVVNYNTRLLGRRGVMEVTLVADPHELDPAVADFKRLMPGYSFAAGEKYSEFKAGDRIAKVGLAALITGGAAVVASKKGWLAALGIALAKLWKLVMVGFIAIGTWLRSLFRRKPDQTVK